MFVLVGNLTSAHDPPRAYVVRERLARTQRESTALVLYVHYGCNSRMRTSIMLDTWLVDEARKFGINVSEAARQGLREAICRHRTERDRAAYLAHPEADDSEWDAAEARSDA